MSQKYKILMLSDHPLTPSGVGIQAQFLIKGLIDTGKYSFRCLGGAITHPHHNTQFVSQDLIIKPVDGFGTKEMLRDLLISEKPDCLILFTDPRQFFWVWEMEDEINQVCPIAYWNIWDNDPYPKTNDPWYASTDLLNCISKKTYNLIKPKYPEKTNYIPHAFPNNVLFPIQEQQIQMLKAQNYGDKKDWFSVLWVNRNATRKMPGDLMVAWKMFLDNLEKKYGHRKAMLIMHTDPLDPNGPNLFALNDYLGCGQNIQFSVDKLNFELMNVLYNMVDCSVNISKAEGFGLNVLSSLMVGKPVVALKTGGLTEQVINDDGEELGVALEPTVRSLVGGQIVPYIYEDIVSPEAVAEAFMKIFELTPEQRKTLSSKCLDHVHKNFSYERMIGDWDSTLQTLIEQKRKMKNWSLSQITLGGTQ